MKSAYKYVRNEEGKIVDILVNGRPIQRSHMRGFRKALENTSLKIYKSMAVFSNPFSGKLVTLNPLEATVYNWCVQWYRQYSAGHAPTPIQTYDDMRYFFMWLNEQAYFDLLD